MALQVLAIPLPGAESHLFVMCTIVNELADRGHDVMVTPRAPYVSTHARQVVPYQAYFVWLRQLKWLVEVRRYQAGGRVWQGASAPL